MRPTTADRRASRRIGLRMCLWLLLAVAIAPVAQGDAPIDPLPVPDYSFGHGSWAEEAGIIEARDVLYLDFPYPGTLVPGYTLELGSPIDDLDALSCANAGVTAQDTFALLFSVAVETLGTAAPDPALIELNVPYNVTNQAALGQAGGDQFMSTQLFTLEGGQGGQVHNNVLARNNYDEGGTDFSAQPATPADENGTDGEYDDVNATAPLERVDDQVVNVYFSVAADSPSLETLPHWGCPSGADIYFNESPPTFQPTDLYAPHDLLHLVADDDLDALIVFDTDQDGWYDANDVVLFSLAPGSPSLSTIPEASGEGAAADVFVVRPGEDPAVFAAAAELGLGEAPDDVNALDFTLCDDALFCAAQHGIRGIRCDLDGDCDVDLDDLAQLLVAYGAILGEPDYNAAADFNGNGRVDLPDLATLLGAYGTTCG